MSQVAHQARLTDLEYWEYYCYYHSQFDTAAIVLFLVFFDNYFYVLFYVLFWM